MIGIASAEGSPNWSRLGRRGALQTTTPTSNELEPAEYGIELLACMAASGDRAAHCECLARAARWRRRGAETCFPALRLAFGELADSYERLARTCREHH